MMPIMARRLWSHDQLVKVLALYCQIPFGKMHSRNPAVVKLAAIIDRTPSAVALKLVNFASLDPELSARGISAMPNISRLDRQVWEDFNGQWEQLAEASAVDVITAVQKQNREEDNLPRPPSGPTEVERNGKARRGQAFFRGAVMAAHQWKCCLTGIATLELLRASHVVPWSKNVSLRLDPRNGLCLNALHDAAFDRGLITFTDELELQISSRLKDEMPTPVYNDMFEDRRHARIAVPERYKPSCEMLRFHRNEIFTP